MAVTKGLDILIYVGSEKTAVGGQKGCTLSMEADSIDISNKSDFGWASTIGGAKSWTVSCDGQFITDDAGQKKLMEAFVAGTEFDDVATLSLELTGVGALKVKKDGSV